jgi:hypothetical protein
MVNTPIGSHIDCFQEFGDCSILVVNRDSPNICPRKGGGIKAIMVGECVLAKENSKDEYEGDIGN